MYTRNCFAVYVSGGVRAAVDGLTGLCIDYQHVDALRGIFVYYLSNIYKISDVAQKHVDAQRRFPKAIAFVSTCSSIYICIYIYGVSFKMT